jgi:hypothetical protein
MLEAHHQNFSYFTGMHLTSFLADSVNILRQFVYIVRIYFIFCTTETVGFATSASETLVNFYQTTRRYNPEDSHLRWRQCLRSLVGFISTPFYIIDLI